MVLQDELQVYRRELPGLTAQLGQFALLRGQEVAGVWPSYAAALRAGYERYGLVPFLVQPIREREAVLIFA
jgi:hypothetical protein